MVTLIVYSDRFEEKFRYDDKGLPKVWKPEDDIDSYFKKARDEVIFTRPVICTSS